MNFEEISRKLKKFSKDTMTEVQKMNEVRQLNARINDEKKKITRTYTEMGKKVYELYKDTPLGGFEADMEAIEECVRMMDLLQDQIREIKGVLLCPCCNMEVSRTERFCSNCGNKMPETIEIVNQADSVVEIEKDQTDAVIESEAAQKDQMDSVTESEADRNDQADAVIESEADQKNQADTVLEAAEVTAASVIVTTEEEVTDALWEDC